MPRPASASSAAVRQRVNLAVRSHYLDLARKAGVNLSRMLEDSLAARLKNFYVLAIEQLISLPRALLGSAFSSLDAEARKNRHAIDLLFFGI